MNRKERRKLGRGAKKRGRTDAAAKGLLKDAYGHLEQGDFRAAEKAFRTVTERAPLDAEAYHMLALIAYREGRLAEAGEMILEAITRDDKDPQLHANCGAIMNLLGRPQEAEAAARHAAALDPDNAEAHNTLAVAVEVQGRLDEALESAGRAVAINPDYVEGHITLGNVKVRAGDPRAAVESFEAALAVAPDNAMARANLAVARRELGDLDAAEAECRRALEISPAFAEARNGLGNVLVAKGDLAGAIETFRAALDRRPGYVEARLNLAAALYRAGETEAAEAEYAAALDFNPEIAEAHAGLGTIALAAGRRDEAVESFRKAVEINPAHGDAQLTLASALGAEATAEQIKAIENAAANDRVPAAERAKLHFARGEIMDARGDAEAAFAAFEAGNAMRRDLLTRTGRGFGADAFEAMVDGIIQAQDKAFLAARAGWGEGTDAPVFVVGVPRSGTTLVEQIAASHPRVAGKGETDRIATLAGGDPRAVETLDAAGAKKMAAEYLGALTDGVAGAGRVSDKTPFNFLYLGLIQALLPGARIVHCVRDPLDTGLSCYFQNFAAPHAWACDLADIGRMIRAHDRLMAHWRETLSSPMHQVRYEDMIKDQEGQSRALIEFLGLDWDAACLRFHESGRTVLTASNWQVRKPLYTSSVGRAKAYEKFLAPLREGLEG